MRDDERAILVGSSWKLVAAAPAGGASGRIRRRASSVGGHDTSVYSDLRPFTNCQVQPAAFSFDSTPMKEGRLMCAGFVLGKREPQPAAP